MFLNILKKDLRRKKTMNIVLLVLITLATALVATGTNLMYTTSTAIDSFISQSKVADFNITFQNTPENNRKVTEWANSDPAISRYDSEIQIGLTAKQIKLPVNRNNVSGNIGLALAAVPQETNLIFDQNNERFELQAGEIAIPIGIKNGTGLKLQDSLTIEIGGQPKSFKVTRFFKDAYIGADLLTLKRLVISQQDFRDFLKTVPEESLTQQWSFTASAGIKTGELPAAFAKEDLPVNFQIDRSLVKMSYLTDQILSVMLFVISLFLIFIAFLTLRFTIVSTLQDDYREIGVMKAIGFKSAAIKGLYLTKYLGLAVVGGCIGFISSMPLTGLMSRNISQYIILPEGPVSVIVAVCSAVAIVAVTLLFCNLCMRKINKASAIDAIRQGQTGERFTASRRIHLHKSKYLHATLFLALSDVLGKSKSYITLVLTFILSTAILIVPVNLTNTILAPEFIGYFGTAPADFYTKSGVAEKPVEDIRQELASVTSLLQDNHFDVTLSVDFSFLAKYISDDGESNKNINGVKSEPTADFQYLDGVAPKLQNEIAITSIMSDNFGKHLGDHIVFEIDGKKTTFLITGLFQTISNEGYMVRMADGFVPSRVNGYQFAGIIHAPEQEKAAIIDDMKEQFKQLDIKSGMDILGEITGGFMGTLKNIIGLITVIVCLITFFITSLFVRLLLSKEVQGIAVMKSLGFTNGLIRVWQVLRIMILMVGSLIIGTLGANILGERLFGIAFRMFGLTEIHFNILPLQVYVLYPLLLLGVVVLAVYTSCGQIKRIQVWNMNKE